MDRPKQAARMEHLFNRIAPSYDRVTRVISLGLDRSWRSRSVEYLRRLSPAPRKILDACCGTGEYTLALCRGFSEASIIGADFAPGMIEAARQKFGNEDAGRVQLIEADLNRLPFGDGSFELVAVAFGLRNSIDYRQSLSELARVVAPGGLLGILEIMTPGSSVFDRILELYVRAWVPLAGWLLGKSFAQYRHLPRSMVAFGGPERIVGDLERLGFEDVLARSVYRNVIYQFTARKPA